MLDKTKTVQIFILDTYAKSREAPALFLLNSNLGSGYLADCPEGH